MNMREKISPRGCSLLDSMLQMPPDFGHIRSLLGTERFDQNEMMRIAIDYVEECFEEETTLTEDTWFFPNCEEATHEEKHSRHLFDLMKLLLDYGLNPNTVVDSENVMVNLKFISNEYAGADTLRLLLEHGGKVDLVVDSETTFDALDFDVIFDAVNQYNRRRYDALVHCWFVYIGFGAITNKGQCPVAVFCEFDTNEPFNLQKLKNHRNYTFGITNVPSKGEKWSLHIFDKATMWEVARL